MPLLKEVMASSEIESSQQSFKDASSIILIVDPETNFILDASPAACAFYGKNLQQLTSKEVSELGVLRKEKIRSIFRKVSAGEIHQFSDHHQLADGEFRHVEIFTGPFQFEGKRANIAIIHDIDARKEAEDKLKESEERYRLLVETSTDAILTTSPDGRILSANAAAAAMFGMTQEELLNSHRDKLIDTTDPAFQHALETRAHTGRTKAILTYIRKDGTKFQGEVTSVLYKDRRGNTQGSNIIRDITEQKINEKKLSDSEKRHRQLFENMREGFSVNEVIADANGEVVDLRILQANAAYEKHTGLNPRDVVGKTLREIIPSTDANNLKMYGNIVKTGEPLVIEYFSTTFNRHFRVNAYRTGPGQFASIIDDITDRKEAEARIAFQASLLDQVRNGVIVIDFDNTILYWNKFAEELYQWKRDEAIGKNIINLLAPEETKDATLKNFAQLNKNGYWEGEYHAKRKDGSTILVQITNTYLKDVDGKNIGFIGVSVDITNRSSIKFEA